MERVVLQEPELSIDQDPVALGASFPLDYGKRDTKRVLGNVWRMLVWEAARLTKRDLVAKLPWGSVRINPSLDVGCTALYVYRRYSAPEVNALTYGVQKGDIAWDVGAHCGTLSRLMSSKGATVRAFEPDKTALPYLLKNAWGHPIEVLEVGLSDRTRAARLSTPLGPQHLRVDHEGVPIRLVRGDEIDEQPSVVKIDVEGHEVQVLEGMITKLPGVRLIVVECHNFGLAEQVVRLLSPLFHLRHYCPEQTEERTWVIGKKRTNGR